VRAYGGALPNTIAFLPARGEHPPAMMSAFGFADEREPGVLSIDSDKIVGIHLTKLRSDGAAKAGTEADKLTIGHFVDVPIMLAPVNDGSGLVIAEGIEDALIAHEATGLGAWAAGSAGRLPSLTVAVPDYVECATLMVDADPAGIRGSQALADGLAARGIEVRLVGFDETRAAA
jgi:hypothetical protein